VRGWVLALVIFVAGIVVIAAVTAAASNGRDNSGETVSASDWADDVCGTVGAWEGQLEAIGDELRESNFAARDNDGGSGDHVEQTIYARDAVNRAIKATNDTLEEGLKRAGIPEVSQGQQASLILRNWARATENRLRVARQTLKDDADTSSAAYASLGPAVGALAQSALEGRAAFKQVSELDSELASAIDDSDNCSDLMKEQP
jgi:hypothetical protein